MPRREINGHLCDYLTQGDPEGLPLVFIHGFPFSQTMWTKQLQALPSSVYAVTYDLRGLGRSEAHVGEAASDVTSMDSYADDLDGLLKLLDIKRPIICALSMGGYIALHAVARHPGLLRGLVLCDTRSGADSDEARAGRSSAALQVRATGMETLVSAQLPNIMTPRSLASGVGWVQELRHVMLSTEPEGAAGALEAMRDRSDTTAALARIDIPVQLIFGEHDQVTPPTEGRSMAAALPDARLAIIEGAGHVSNLENPAQFNAALLDYLQQFLAG